MTFDQSLEKYIRELKSGDFDWSIHSQLAELRSTLEDTGQRMVLGLAELVRDYMVGGGRQQCNGRMDWLLAGVCCLQRRGDELVYRIDEVMCNTTCLHIHTHSHTFTHTHTHTHTHSLSLSLTLSHMHAHTHTHARAHTHTLSLSLFLSIYLLSLTLTLHTHMCVCACV